MNKNITRLGKISLAVSMVIPSVGVNLTNVAAQETEATSSDKQLLSLPEPQSGYRYISAVSDYDVDKNAITLNLEAGEKIRFTFLENNMFRMYMAPEGEEFLEYPKPNSTDHTATITNKTDDAFTTEYNVKPSVGEAEGIITIITDGMTITIDKATSMMKVANKSGVTVIEEKAPLQYKTGSTIQTLATSEDEYFYGGGTQNGRFSHKGEKINIVATNTWNDGNVTSPNPFYWSTKGYGVLRNTWKPGAYDFTSNDAITTTHNEKRFDAYFFVDDTAKDLLGDYYELTGNPAELPEYASYLGHLNCYNRDYWVETTEGKGIKLGDKWYTESSTDNGGNKETLNGSAPYTAESIINEYKNYDMPLGWFLPNDGYGCGYGQADTQAGNLENLGEFAKNSIAKGVQTGLWTQSNLWPANPANPGKDERDITKEVQVGVHAVKTDVAWVGAGYSMALNGISVAYDAIETNSGMKPNIVTLDGWAGTQRYGGIWSGDQTGGQWEYIRFHIPTYIGTALSGQPNIGSDMDGIFGGKNMAVWTRDFQWKAFTTYMLDMDGWGSNQKSPWALGEDGTSINRAYLKLKAQLMPYNNTISHEATAEGGLPMIRAMFLEEENPYTLGTATEYQYMWGDQFLVAPVYQNTASDADGNDIRNDIYLPGNTDIWVDYFTGKQYLGGQILDNFDAPIWKLPVFVKNGSIIPIYPENNNPEAITETNTDGLDRSQRIVEFYPYGETEFTAYEDDGKTLSGAGTTTRYTSAVEGTTVTLTAEKTVGRYEGMVTERSTEFIVNVSEAPTAVTGTVAGQNTTFTEVKSLEEYEKATGNVYFYDEAPMTIVEQYASANSSYKDMEEATTPKLRIKSTDKLNINDNEFKVVVEGFKNAQELGGNELDEAIAVPQNLNATEVTDSVISLAWDVSEGAVTYDIEVDGYAHRNLQETAYVHDGLSFLTDHTYRVRAVDAKGNYSAWSEAFNQQTADNPYRNVPTPEEITWTGGLYGNHYASLAFDQIFQSGDSGFHSSSGATGKELIVDYGVYYALDKIEYYPRSDAGNGTVTKMDVSYSLDGRSWTEPKTYNWERSSATKVIDDATGQVARYVKFVPRASVGDFFSAREILIYKENGTVGRPVGDTNNSGALDDGDLVFYQNYTGLKQSDSDWNYINNVKGDIDWNGIVDAYDFSNVATQLNGGITKPATGVDGKIQLIPSKTDIKKGDVVTIDVLGIGMKNVNAFSVEMPVSGQFVATPAAATLATAYMSNYSKNRTHSDQTVDNYTLFTNIGTQALLNGTQTIAKITITANEDFTWDTLATSAVLVGQDMSTVDGIIDETQRPVAPETKKILTASNVAMTFTNETGDVAGNDLFQQSNWKSILFDGKSDGDMAEFKWDLETSPVPDNVLLPTDFNMDLGKARPITTITIAGRPSSNGALTKSKLSYIDGNDVLHELGESTEKSPSWAINDTVKKFIWTPEESTGTASFAPEGKQKNRMLSLYEIIIEEDSAVNATGISFDEGNPTEVNIGRLVEVSATVTPNNATNPFYNITAKEGSEDLVGISKIPTAAGYIFLVQGRAAGEATLVATSEDGSFTDEFTITVAEGVYETDLNNKLAEVNAKYAHLYTAESWAKVRALADEAEAYLNSENPEQSVVDQYVIDIQKEIDALELKGSLDKPSSENLISQSGMTMYDESSFSAEEREHASNAIDGNKATIWHSNYYNTYTLPQWFTIDLGEEYELEQVDYLARQGSRNGHVTHYRIDTSLDGEEFTPVVEGYFKNDGTQLEDPEIAKEIKFEPTAARYVRFVALESLGDTKNMYASCAEINFYGVTNDTAYNDLLDAIADVKALDESVYTTSTWAKLAAVLTEAENVASDAGSAVINNAIQQLTDMKAALQRRADVPILAALNVQIAKAEALDNTSMKLEALVEEAKAIIADPSDVTGTHAAALAVAISNEIANLSEVDDSEILKANLAETLIFIKENILNNTEGLKDEIVDELRAVVKEAEAMLEMDATAEELTAMTQKVAEVVERASRIVNKDSLKAVIELAKAYTPEGWTEESYNALQEAIASAEQVANDDDATSAQVTDAVNQLLDAIAKLEKDTLATAALELEITMAQNIINNIDNYISTTVEDLAEELANAKNVLATAKTQDEIDVATKALREVRMQARRKANTTALVEVIAEVENMDLSIYSEPTKQDLLAAIANGRDIANNEFSSQKQVDDALAAIKAAVENLSIVNPSVDPDDDKTDGEDNKPGTDVEYPGTTGNGAAGNGNGGTANATTNTSTPKTGATDSRALLGLVTLASAGALLALRKKKEDDLSE